MTMLINNQYKKVFIVLFIFLVAFGIRGFYIVQTADYVVTADAKEYDSLAMSIARGEGLGYSPEAAKAMRFHPGPTARRVPGYPVFMSLIYLIFGHSVAAARIANALLGAASCVLIYYLAEQIKDKRAGLLAGYLAAVYPAFILIRSGGSGDLVTETLFIFVLLCFMFLFLRFIRRPRIVTSLLASIVLGVLMLIKSAAALFGPFIFIWFLFIKGWRLKDRLIRAAFILAVAMFVVMPWVVRNYLIFGQPIYSTQGGLTFYLSNNADAKGAWAIPQGEYDYYEGLKGRTDEPFANKELFLRGLDYVGSNLKQMPKLVFMKILVLWNPFNPGYSMFYGIMLFLFILGFFMRKGVFQAQDWRFLLLPVLYFTFIAAVFHGKPRFRLPLEPFLIIAASAVLIYLKDRLKRHAFGISLAVLLVVNVILKIYSSPISGFLGHILDK